MPVLFQFMDNAITAQQQQLQAHTGTGLTKIFYALETFGTHLGAGLLPYLDQLMDKLFLILSVTCVCSTCLKLCWLLKWFILISQDVHVQELVVSGFSAAGRWYIIKHQLSVTCSLYYWSLCMVYMHVAEACEEKLLPYFPRIMEVLKV